MNVAFGATHLNGMAEFEQAQKFASSVRLDYALALAPRAPQGEGKELIHRSTLTVRAVSEARASEISTDPGFPARVQRS